MGIDNKTWPWGIVWMLIAFGFASTTWLLVGHPLYEASWFVGVAYCWTFGITIPAILFLWGVVLFVDMR